MDDLRACQLVAFDHFTIGRQATTALLHVGLDVEVSIGGAVNRLAVREQKIRIAVVWWVDERTGPRRDRDLA